jgi:hypothetical protein
MGSNTYVARHFLASVRNKFTGLQVPSINSSLSISRQIPLHTKLLSGLCGLVPAEYIAYEEAIYILSSA